MKELIVGNEKIELNDEGYLIDSTHWSPDVAIELAKKDGFDLTPKHFEVLEYLRKTHAAGETLTIRKVGKSGIVNIKELYQLFPGGPLKLSSKFAGIPKPTSCV